MGDEFRRSLGPPVRPVHGSAQGAGRGRLGRTWKAGRSQSITCFWVCALPHREQGRGGRTTPSTALEGQWVRTGAMLALYDFYHPSEGDLLGEVKAGWTIVATFLLLLALVW